MFIAGQARPLGAGRKRGTPNKDTSEVARLCDELECSPMEILIGIAQGMVVELGYMTLEEYEAPAEVDHQGCIQRESGKIRALQYLPPELRANCAIKLCEFLYPKRKAVDMTIQGKVPVPVVPIPGLPPDTPAREHG